jgi:hypothetical protein
VAQFATVPGLRGGGKLADILLFQARATPLSRFVRFDTGGTEHNDGIGDPFFFELYQWMEVLRQDAQGPGRGAFEKPVIFMRGFWGMLGLGLWLTCGHGVSLRKMQTIIVGIAEARGNVFRRGCVELNTLRETAFSSRRGNEANQR